MRYLTNIVGLMIVGFMATGPAWAIPIANPNPSLLADDIGGTGLFNTNGSSLGIEILDLGPVLTGGPGSPFPSTGFGGSEFGFYFANDPTSLTAIFDPTDQDPDPGGPGSITQLASIDFLAGQVLDMDDGGTLQSTFDPASSGPIGFYLTLADDLVNYFGFGFNTLYSQPHLNSGGQDMAAAYPLLDNTGYLLGFAADNPFNSVVDYFFFGASIATNVTPVVVPEPSSWALFLLGGMICLVGMRANGRRLTASIRV